VSLTPASAADKSGAFIAQAKRCATFDCPLDALYALSLFII